MIRLWTVGLMALALLSCHASKHHSTIEKVKVSSPEDGQGTDQQKPQQPTYQPIQKSFSIHKAQGEPYELRWKDGRVATAYMGQISEEYSAVPISLFENTCKKAQAIQCTYKLVTGITLFELRWTKHHQTEKLGKVVKAMYPEPTGPIDLTDGYVFWGMADAYMKLPIAKNIKPDLLSCPNWSWLPDHAESSAPDHLVIESVGHELMVPNDETGASENRTVGSIADLRYKRISDQELQFVSFADFQSGPFFIGGSLIAGDILHYILRKKDQTNCHVTFKIDFSAIDQGAIEKKIRSKFEPYLMEEFDRVALSFLNTTLEFQGKELNVE